MGRQSPMERAMRLAAVTGLKATFGPALIAASQHRPERRALAIAAIGEMFVDKVPFVPSRSRLPLLLPRAFAGYWTAKKSLEADGIDDPASAAMGAVVAAGVALIAPLARRSLGAILGVPDAVVGAGEDYMALRVGGEAAGLSMDDLKSIAVDAVEGVRDQLGPVVSRLEERLHAAT